MTDLERRLQAYGPQIHTTERTMMKLFQVHGAKRRWFDDWTAVALTFCGRVVDVDNNRQRLSASPTPVTCTVCKVAMRHRGRSLAEQWADDTE
jgi:hypothetical protein